MRDIEEPSDLHMQGQIRVRCLFCTEAQQAPFCFVSLHFASFCFVSLGSENEGAHPSQPGCKIFQEFLFFGLITSVLLLKQVMFTQLFCFV
jgi:hypothetical protein